MSSVICANPSCNNLTTNPMYCSLSCSSSHKGLIVRTAKITEYNLNPKKCLECETPLPYKDHRTKNFCNHSCAAKYTNAKKDWSKIKKMEKEPDVFRNKNGKKLEPDQLVFEIKWITCIITKRIYHSKTKFGGNRQQSPYILDIKDVYSSLTNFKFNVYDFPNYFDLQLLDQYGWYSCPDNISGVSRDHRYSRSVGFKNKVHPLILSHPANCRLLLHSDNYAKFTNCDIGIDVLVSNIMNFEYNFSHHQLIINIINDEGVYFEDYESLRVYV